jgi:octaheme c-type cytochrome (tetrathionate reductase family)
MKKLTIIILMLVIIPIIALSDKTADHTKFEILKQDFKNATEVTKACLTCHTQASHQVMSSIHWTWSKTTKGGKEIGKSKVINNFCVAVPSNEPRCTSCHTGYGWKNDKFDFTSEENVDCLVCHEQTMQYKKFPTAAGHPVYEEKMFQKEIKFTPQNLSAIAQSVGRPTNFNCGTCHFYGGGGNGVKHGDMDKSLLTADKKLDVHMGQGMTCIDCHKAELHRIPGTKYEYVNATERPSCANSSCHSEAPHHNSKLNDHSDKVACQTCHIPQYARGGYPTKMWWDWSKAGDKTRKNSKDYNVKKGEFKWAKNVQPDYFWHNGNFSKMYIATDRIDPSQTPICLNELDGKPTDPNSRIYPFKIHRGLQPYDTKLNNFIIPRLFGPVGSGAYWKNFDWNLAAKAGMEYNELPYSGSYDFIETSMNWPITHMVAPKEDALQCNDCHTSEEHSLMAGVEGVYIPGRDQNKYVDNIGLGVILLSVIGVLTHFVIGTFSRKRVKKEEDKDEK